jgi:L-iditol 2-dehydrogenase
MPLMLAAVATALGRVEAREIDAPQPETGKVLVRTRLASICGSDLHIVYMGWNVAEYPLPPGHPGHEGVGEVVDGGGSGFLTGDLVLTVPRVSVAGTFAEFQLVDPGGLLRLPEDPPLSQLLMAQQLGTVIHGCRRLPPLAGKTVAVVGQGSAGLFHDFVLRRLGAQRIIAIEPVPERLAAAGRLGADELIDLTGDAATAAVMELTGGLGADVVVEAVGSVETLNQAIVMTRRSGHVAVFGMPPTTARVPFDWDTFFRRGLNLYAPRGAQEEPGLPAFRRALELITEGDIDVSPFTTHRFPVSRVQDAFDLAHARGDGALKVSLTL